MGGGVYSYAMQAAAMVLARNTVGVSQVRRPESADSPAFDLAYVRTGPRSERPPTVVIPGGPGLGSILPYRTMRAIAARRGIDLIMVEHRGVGLSRHDLAGRDMPATAMRVVNVVDDIAAVLDRERVSRAQIVGSSYGSYLASSFGVMHPGRVSGMVLDSALQSANELELERQVLRGLLWDAASESARRVRALAETGVDGRVLLDVVRAAYELGGDRLLGSLLRRRLRSHRSWAWRALAAYATRGESIARIPGVYEFDLAGTIGFRELGYGALPDGLPLDPACTYAPLAYRFPAFEGEPFDLATETAAFTWPMVLVSGARDLRTPPAIAARTAAVAPQAVTVSLENGHSVLDTHPVALLNVIEWLAAGRQNELPGIAWQLDQLPRRGAAARAQQLLECVLRV